jgi:eukaryotic-like serine/threonine-protein kinase
MNKKPPNGPEPIEPTETADQARALIERIAQAYASADPQAASGFCGQDFTGQYVGAYRLIEHIGRGGMGDVYRAERHDGVHDAQVAIKLLRASLDADTLTRRFHRERRILARLNHPNIAHLLDGGSTASGLPYLVMEWVEGQTLTAYALTHSLDLQDRLQLFMTVCGAVASAHRNLIVHRDLKPGNILVTDHGQVKLLDFGISKLLAEEDDTELPLTRTGWMPMTPAYAAPEQILGKPVTTATDVYALGVVLYELLTGDRPHQRDSQAIAALVATIDSEVITRPSEKVRATNAHPSHVRWSRRLRGDLDTIVMTALKPEPDRRYPSAEALAEDLRRYLKGQPISARPDSLPYRVGKFLLRYRVAVSATALIILALVAGLSVALWQAQLAREQAEHALRTKAFVISLLQDANPGSSSEGVELKAVELLRRSVDRVENELDRTPDLQAELRMVLAQALLSMGDLHTAAEVGERGVEQLRSIYGRHSAQLAEGLYALARIRVRTGPIEAAEELVRESLVIFDRKGPTPDLMRARAKGLLANVSNQRGQHLEAMTLYSQALDERIALLGEDDPGLAVAYSNMATTAIQAERFTEAETGYRKAYQLLNDAWGPEHPGMATVHLGLGTALNGLGQFELAESEFNRALEIGTLRLGPTSESVLVAMSNLGQLRVYQQRLDEAVELFAEAAALADGTGLAWVQTVALMRLGVAYQHQQRYSEAVEALNSALVLLQERFPERAHLRLTQVALGLALASDGRLEKGVQLAKAGIDNLSLNSGDQHLPLAEAAELYSHLLLLNEQPEPAREWLTRSVQISSQILGDSHPHVTQLNQRLNQLQRQSHPLTPDP